MVQTAKELQYCVNNVLLRRDKDEMVARDGQDLRVPTLSLQTSHPARYHGLRTRSRYRCAAVALRNHHRRGARDSSLRLSSRRSLRGGGLCQPITPLDCHVASCSSVGVGVGDCGAAVALYDAMSFWRALDQKP